MATTEQQFNQLAPAAISQEITATITKKIIVKAVASIKTLPSPPKVYMQLTALLNEKNTDSQKIALVIMQDPALAAKVLQFSNSAILSAGKGTNHKVLSSIPEAITKMGVDTLCCIVMTAELFSYNPDIDGFSIIKEQLHSLATAKMAASMVKPELKQDAMLAGLLHDIGKVVLYEINPTLTQTFFKHRNANKDNILLEQKVFGTDHCQIGGYLLHLWKFSLPLIEAIVLHHSPNKLHRKSFGVPQAVYVANQLLHGHELSEDFVTHYQLTPVLDKLKDKALKIK